MYDSAPWAAAITPLFALIQVALFLTMAAMLISLVNTGAILAWHLPPEVPVWAGALILLVGYQIVVAPLRAAQQWNLRGPAQPLFAFWNAVIWLSGMAVAFWIASNHIPEIREFIQRLPGLFRQFAEAMRGLVSEPR